MYPIIFQNNSLTTVIDNVPYTVDKTSSNYSILIQAYRDKDWTTFANSITPTNCINNWTNDKISIVNGSVIYNGHTIGKSISDRITKLIEQNIPVDVYVNFLDNLLQNPSYRAVTEFYTFMEHNDLPMTSDGHFLSYRRVRSDYLDCHSGRVPNMLALDLAKKYPLPFNNVTGDGVTVTIEDDLTTISMPRNRVNDDSSMTCSNGLHFCGKEYLSSFNTDGRTMIMKINPRDVVSFPTDSFAKGRCSRYQLVGEIESNEIDTVFEKAVVDLPVINEGPMISDSARYGIGPFYDGYKAGYLSIDTDEQIGTVPSMFSNGTKPHAYVGSTSSLKIFHEGFDKGRNDAEYDIPMQYVHVGLVEGVKFGNTPFYEGYHDGYMIERNFGLVKYRHPDIPAYLEGFDKGVADGVDLKLMRYVFTG